MNLKEILEIKDALRYCQYSEYSALIVRKSYRETKELFYASRVLYEDAFPGAKYNKMESTWHFPSGATIEFGCLDRPEDLERYRGRIYAYIAFDDTRMLPDIAAGIMSRLRPYNPGNADGPEGNTKEV